MRRRRFLQASLLALTLPPSLRAAEPLRVAVFPDYNVPAVLSRFSAQHGIAVQLVPFDSNEDVLNACVRGERFDLITLSHYMVPHFAALGLLQPVSTDTITALGPDHWEHRFRGYGQIGQRWLAVPKNCGTTGFLYRASRLPALTSWREFWDMMPGKAARRCSVIDDVQSLLGAALRYDQHSINSTRPRELVQAEQLLQRSRPHLRALVADVSEAVADGDWLAMAWSDSGYSISAADADIRFVNPQDGGEQWGDYYAVAQSSTQLTQAELLLRWLLAPAQIAEEVIALGVTPVDDRVLPLLPAAVRSNPIIFPPRALLAQMEMSSQEALREPLRSEIFSRFSGSF